MMPPAGSEPWTSTASRFFGRREVDLCVERALPCRRCAAIFRSVLTVSGSALASSEPSAETWATSPASDAAERDLRADRCGRYRAKPAARRLRCSRSPAFRQPRQLDAVGMDEARLEGRREQRQRRPFDRDAARRKPGAVAVGQHQAVDPQRPRPDAGNADYLDAAVRRRRHGRDQPGKVLASLAGERQHGDGADHQRERKQDQEPRMRRMRLRTFSVSVRTTGRCRHRCRNRDRRDRD